MSLAETAAFKAAAYSSSATAPSRDSSTTVCLIRYGVSLRYRVSEDAPSVRGSSRLRPLRQPLTEGLAAVRVGAPATGKWGYISR
jgi:hypothetical protein